MIEKSKDKDSIKILCPYFAMKEKNVDTLNVRQDILIVLQKRCVQARCRKYALSI